MLVPVKSVSEFICQIPGRNAVTVFPVAGPYFEFGDWWYVWSSKHVFWLDNLCKMKGKVCVLFADLTYPVH